MCLFLFYFHVLWYVGDEGVVAVAFSYGAEEAVGQTNVCARRKRLNFQGVCTVRETTVDLQVHALLFSNVFVFVLFSRALVRWR